jgi:hypothetical protein
MFSLVGGTLIVLGLPGLYAIRPAGGQLGLIGTTVMLIPILIWVRLVALNALVLPFIATHAQRSSQ